MKRDRDCTKCYMLFCANPGSNTSKQWLYGHQLPISQTIPVRLKRYVGYCWRIKDELMWRYPMESYIQSPQCWPTSKDLYELCTDTGCNSLNLLEEMDDGMDGKRESRNFVLSAWLDDDNVCVYLGSCFSCQHILLKKETRIWSWVFYKPFLVREQNAPTENEGFLIIVRNH